MATLAATMATPNPPKPTWNKQEAIPTVEIYVEGPTGTHPNLVVTGASRDKLFRWAPALQEFVVDDSNDKILLPGDQYGVNDDVVHAAITDLLGSKDGHLTFTVDPEPRGLIQDHVVLVLCGLHREAKIVEEQIWNKFKQKRLTLDDIQWVWETFGPFVAMLRGQMTPGSYVPPYSELYLQAMLWRVLDMKAEGEPPEYVAEWISKYCRAHSGLSLEKMGQERLAVFGLEPGFTMPEALQKPDRTLHRPTISAAGGKTVSTTKPAQSTEKPDSRAKLSPQMKLDRAGANLNLDPNKWAHQQTASQGQQKSGHGSDTDSGRFGTPNSAGTHANGIDADSGVNNKFGPQPTTLKPPTPQQAATNPTPFGARPPTTPTSNPPKNPWNATGFGNKFFGPFTTSPAKNGFSAQTNATASPHQPGGFTPAGKAPNVAFGFGTPTAYHITAQKPAGSGNPLTGNGIQDTSPFSAFFANTNPGQSATSPIFGQNAGQKGAFGGGAGTNMFGQVGTTPKAQGGFLSQTNGTPSNGQTSFFNPSAGTSPNGQAGVFDKPTGSPSVGQAGVFGQIGANNQFGQTGQVLSNGSTDMNTSFGQPSGNAFGSGFGNTHAQFGGNGQSQPFGSTGNAGANSLGGAPGGSQEALFTFTSPAAGGAGQTPATRNIKQPRRRLPAKKH